MPSDKKELSNPEFFELLEKKKRNTRLRKTLRAHLRSLFTQEIKDNLYRVSRSLKGDVKTELGVNIEQLFAYVQDPEVARKKPKFGILPFHVRWEPGLGDGPTSARFAVVDYNMDSATLTPPASWNAKTRRFEDPGEQPLDKNNKKSFQFHQANLWAVAQTTLDYFEEPVYGMGRSIPWAFEGHRLILVPHAGYGENAFYDRHSKSLQFYYFGDKKAPTYTCLSHDIIAHETGHALLDGIRPLYFDYTSLETAAFHEFIGDLTALLLILRRNEVRKAVAEEVDGDLRKDDILGLLAEEFGMAIDDSEALRNAHKKVTLAELRKKGSRSPHFASRVLTTAMFEILVRMADVYRQGITDDGKGTEKTPAQALAFAQARFAHVALRPIDMCPPMDVRFLDYARAVVHHYEGHEPGSSPRLKTFSRLIRKVFHDWKFCARSKQEHEQGICDLNLENDKMPTRLPFHHNMIDVARSRTAAYYYLNDNRKTLKIPHHQDFEIVDLYGLSKFAEAGHRLPREIVIEYLWREEYELEGKEYGKLQGETIELLCGGTLMIDEYGNIISLFDKPGQDSPGEGAARGRERLQELRDHILQQVKSGHLGLRGSSEVEVFGSWSPPIVADRDGGALRLEITPHVRESFDPESEQPKKAKPKTASLWDEGEDRWTTSF